MPKFIENRAQILIKSTIVPQNPAKLILIDKKALLSPIKGDLDGYRLAFSRYFSYLCIRTSLRYSLSASVTCSRAQLRLTTGPPKGAFIVGMRRYAVLLLKKTRRLAC